MAYIIEQKIKDRIYLYKVESYWDKDKKQSRQKRTYLGPKNPKKKLVIRKTNATIIHKNYGNVFLLRTILQRTGLSDIIKNVFPYNHKEIIALAFYEIIEASPLYLFPYWLQEHYMPKTKKIDSSGISKLCDFIGHQQQLVFDFIEQWIKHLQPVEALYYDVTSISSYSTNIDYVEWGYNRDKEKLPQVNLGLIYSQKHALPIYYAIHQGSIVDVNTLKNKITYLKKFGLKQFVFVLDRGFCSISNIKQMSKADNDISFIQPLSFSLKIARELVKSHKKVLHDINSSFKYNNEMLSHAQSEIYLSDTPLIAHVFLNEKVELDQRQRLLSELIEIEENIIRHKTFDSLKAATDFKKNNIQKKYQELFKWNRQTKNLERKSKTIKAKIARFGYFVIVTNIRELDRISILENYRNRDNVEKVFDLLKNEMDGNRLRAHNSYNSDARLFIKFISLIIQSEIIRTMKNKKLFKKYTLHEMLANLRKIKLTKIDNDKFILSEVSKQNRLILEAFNIDPTDLHRY